MPRRTARYDLGAPSGTNWCNEASQTMDQDDLVNRQALDLLESLERFTLSGAAFPLPSSTSLSHDEPQSSLSLSKAMISPLSDHKMAPPTHKQQQQHDEVSQREQHAAYKKWTQQMREAVLDWVRQQHESMKQQQLHHDRELSACLDALDGYKRASVSLQKTVVTLEQELSEVRTRALEKQQQLEEAIQEHQKRLLECDGREKEDRENNDAGIMLSSAKSTVSFPSIHNPRQCSSKKGLSGNLKPLESSKLSAPCLLSPTEVSPQTASGAPTNNMVVQTPLAGGDKQEQTAPRSSHGRTRIVSPTGCHTTHYRNGSQKEQYPDGTTVIRYCNGDIQTWFGSPGHGSAASYFFASSNVLQVQYDDGSIQWHYRSGQVEEQAVDGSRRVLSSPEVINTSNRIPHTISRVVGYP
jgi:hypothetical protein